MDLKQKTAAVSALLSLLLATAKFILAGLSGSLVILADAWHSLTDVATSALVFFSVSAGKKSPDPAPETDQPPEGPDWKNVTPERWVSLLIGFVILLAALGVAVRAFHAPAREIENAFLYGIFFLVFAGGSLVVSLFEVRVGKRIDSPGLIADGLHSRADMVTSLVAAGALIAYRLGINLDRAGAVIVVVFICSFSFETLVNFWWSLLGRTRWEDRSASGFAAALLQPRNWNRLGEGLGQLCAWAEWPPRARAWFRRGAAGVLIAGAGVLAALSCLTVVGPAELGIRERWGRVVNRGRPLPPGLHWHLPAPAERILRVDARSIRRMEIGSVADPRAVALLWTRPHGEEEAFLSAEDNFFHPYFAIHYRVKDIFDYRFSLRRPEELLENAANRILTRLFSTRTFIEIVTAYREEMEETVRELLQEKLDELGSGLELLSVNAKDIHPPFEVADAYEQVIASMQQKQTRINRARVYHNSTIPEARGRAARSLEEAAAYVVERQEDAEGEAGRFLARTGSIAARPGLIRAMLYREAVRDALENQPLVLVDPDIDGPDLWLRQGRPFFVDSQF